MNTQMTIHEQFAYQGHALRTEQDPHGEPLFHAGDLCAILDYRNPRDAVRRHVHGEDVVKCDTLTAGGVQAMNYVREPGMWSLILGSETPAAAQVKRWVTAEVLPSIRRTGGYRAAPPPKATVEIEPGEYIELLQAQIKLLKGERPAKVRRPAPVPLTDDEKLRILELHEQGLGPTDIARELGRSRTAVRSVIRELGSA